MDNAALISAFPSKARTDLARQNYYFKVLSSLAYLISVGAPNRDCPNISTLVRTPLSSGALEPRLFYLHDALLLAMRAQDVNRVQQTLQAVEEVAKAGMRIKNDHIPEIISIGDADWENFIVENSINLGEEYFNKCPEIAPVSEDVAAEQRGNVIAALELIEEFFPAMHEEVQGLLNKLRLFKGAVTMGITDVRMFGCMLIRTPRPEVNTQLYYAEHITHETSHMYLNAAMSIDPILLNDRSELFTSPLRPDPRPMIGVFHATFVTSRIVQLFESLSQDWAASEDTDVYLYQQLDELKAGINEVTRGAKLTPTGALLLREFEEIAQNADQVIAKSGLDTGKVYMHRFGGGTEFKPAKSIDKSVETHG
ncbi:aKG-HExxH-type peptide beta-hydroxylase [Ochrobactrum sp. EDr1-4]|uniref:aKG-HExxH-type peptide beta-hydroxylase n=1 Tax=Ochrobactrum sp. EDr1-4 TaxID=3368622 RepID=UPI003BA1DD78